MKRSTKILSLILALVMLLGVTVYAADTILDNKKATIEAISNGKSTVTFASDKTDEEKIVVTYTSDSLSTPNGQYLILMVTSDEEGNLDDIGDDSVLYINQLSSADAVEGTLTFTVYASVLRTGTIIITNATDGTVEAAIVKAKYVLGDIDENGYINVSDALLILQHVVGITTLTDAQKLPANTDGNEFVNVSDALLILQLVVGIITEL